MLSKVEVKTRRGTMLTLPLYEDEGGYKVSDIEGLDPVEASLVSSSYAGIDGEQFHSARRGPRDITISLDFEPDYVNHTVTTLRKQLYSFLMPKSEVTLRFHQTTGLYVDIVARVESFDSKIFSKDPTAEIALRCFKPDLIDPRLVVVEGFTVDDETVQTIAYPGTVETGIVMTLSPQRDLTAFTVYNTADDNEPQQLEFGAPLLTGDVLVISSLSGAKGITLTRENVSRSYLYGRSPQSGWIELREGDNDFRVFANGDPIPYELQYMVRYGGL